jgi:hypothetical protein
VKKVNGTVEALWPLAALVHQVRLSFSGVNLLEHKKILSSIHVRQSVRQSSKTEKAQKNESGKGERFLHFHNP